MITLFGRTFSWNDPEILIIGGAILTLVLLLILILRAAGRSGAMAAPLMAEMGWMSQRVQALSDGQERLAGGLHHVSENQAVSQSAMLELLEKRLSEVQRSMGEAKSKGFT
jgi:DNA recombination protein RmuC